MTGHSSCNGFFGTYTIQKNRLSFGPIGMTRMACEDVRDLEMQFMKSLAETDEFKLSGNALTFFSLGKPVALFVGSDIEK